MRITDTWLRTVKPRKARYDVTTELRGLMVRVHPSGAVSFRYRYKRGKDQAGKPVQFVIVLGEYGKRGAGMTLEDAHEFQRKAQRWLALGLDPIEEKEKEEQLREKARRERAEADTVASLVEQFSHRRLRGERWDDTYQEWVRNAKIRARKRPEDAEALLKANLVDVNLDGQSVGSRKARELTKQQLNRILRQIVDRGAAVTANRVHALFVQMLNWAVSVDILPASPLAGSQRPGGEEKPRKRKLTHAEIKVIWEKLPTAAMAAPTKLALKLLLVTGQRRGELTFAKKAHFDLTRKVWTIPVGLQKSADQTNEPTEPHEVPLSDLAMRVVRELFALSPTSEWVLPSQYRKKKANAPYSTRVLTRAVAENEDHFGIPHWRPHDLRRACRTGLSRLKVPRELAERVINHAQPKLDETYDQHDYLAEKRDALARWAAHLQDIITGKDNKDHQSGELDEPSL